MRVLSLAPRLVSTGIRALGRRGVLVAAMVAVGIIVSASGCDKVPLLAPSGTVITLFPVSSTVALNSEVEIVATVIEQGQATAPPTNGNGNGNGTTTPPTNGTTTTPTTGAGTPVHNGTVVSFTTTLGRIEPAEARTQNGQVRVKFISGGQSGTATITAFSGGASGRLENLRVGTAAVERVIVTANPQTLGASGGTAEISARVEDISGLPVVGVAVNFTASAGQIAPNPAVTDANGVARATLNTTREANLTATVAGKTSEQLTVGLNPRTGVGITPPTNTPAAGQPAIFTVNVSADANIRNVVIDWGDGTSTTLGALSASTPVSHTYLESGTFSVRVTATDASGFTETVATVVTILPSQPPGVTVRASNTNPVVNEDVILTATVTGATSTIIRYEWNFGNGSNSPPITTSGPQATTSWATVGSKTVSVRAVQATGPAGEGFATVVVRAAFAPSEQNKPN